MNLKKIVLFFKRNINYLIIFSILLFFFAGSFGKSFLEMMRLLKLKSDLTQQIAASEEESSQLDEDIAQIGTQSYVEGIARKYLELYYPNEQIVIPVENSLSEQAKANQKKRLKEGTNTDNVSSQEDSTNTETTESNQEEESPDSAQSEEVQNNTETDEVITEDAVESEEETDTNEASEEIVSDEESPEQDQNIVEEDESIE